MKPIAPNTLIQNRYLIVHLIGKGGMGEVYLAVDQRLGSAVALKRTFFSDDATLGHAFEREARTLARLRHPVLPKVSDHFTEEGTQYLVMEHISGEDISKRLESAEKLFPISWVLFWADQLLDALNYLHSHEPPIVHRDIKPQNLKLTDENHIVLLDFGLSKNSVGETRTATTSGGSIVGYTPHYAPMEQIRGTGTDARSDLYSLSATLYQILTNQVPPDALTRADSLINGLPDPVTPISELNPEVSKAVSDVILKGMAISQEPRYKTAREMQKALRDAYAQLQSGMMANTVVLNTGTLTETPAAASPAPPTAPTSSAPPPAAVAAPPTPAATPAVYDSGALGANANRAAPPNGAGSSPNFDQTVRYDSQVLEPSAASDARQSDIKTEVFLAGSSAAISSVQAENYRAPHESFAKTDGNGKHDAPPPDEDFFTKPEANNAANFAPGGTVPLFTFDQDGETGAGRSAADSFSGGARTKSNGSTFVPAENGAPNDQRDPAPAAVPAAPKSGGKGLMIAGGLFALLVLAVGGLGLGWFLTRGDGGATVETPRPTPVAQTTPTLAPTVEPTLEVAIEPDSANTNATNVNSSVETVPTPANSNPGINTVPTRPAQNNNPPAGTTTATTRPDAPKPPTSPKPPPSSNKTPTGSKTPTKKIIIEP